MIVDIINTSVRVKYKLLKDRIVKPKVAANIVTTLPFGRYDHAQEQLPNGDIIIFGGLDENSNITDTAFTFSYNTKTYEFVRPLPKKLYGHAVIKSPNNEIFIFGGFDENDIENSNIYMYDYNEDRYYIVGQLLEPCGYLKCGIYRNMIAIPPGFKKSANSMTSTTVYGFDYNNYAITTIRSLTSITSYGYGSFYSSDYKKFFVFGGIDPSTNSVSYRLCWFDDTTSLTYSIENWSYGYAFNTIINLVDKYAVMIGGKKSDGTYESNLSFMDIDTGYSYNEYLLVYNSVLPYGIYKHTASKHSNTNSILLFGGLDSNNIVNKSIIEIKITF